MSRMVRMAEMTWTRRHSWRCFLGQWVWRVNAGLLRFAESSLEGVSGAADEANLVVASVKEEMTDTAEFTTVVRAAILESVELDERLDELVGSVPVVSLSYQLS